MGRCSTVFGINCVSKAGKKIVIVQGEAKHYYSFACITRAINSKYYINPYCCSVTCVLVKRCGHAFNMYHMHKQSIRSVGNSVLV